jgi:hypothetical protein
VRALEDWIIASYNLARKVREIKPPVGRKHEGGEVVGSAMEWNKGVKREEGEDSDQGLYTGRDDPRGDFSKVLKLAGVGHNLSINSNVLQRSFLIEHCFCYCVVLPHSIA